MLTKRPHGLDEQTLALELGVVVAHGPLTPMV